jgi:hypothetical protein
MDFYSGKNKKKRKILRAVLVLGGIILPMAIFGDLVQKAMDGELYAIFMLVCGTGISIALLIDFLKGKKKSSIKEI